ncbi:MAG: FHA domain-containing protein [Planctomycetaceae bacterium]
MTPPIATLAETSIPSEKALSVQRRLSTHSGSGTVSSVVRQRYMLWIDGVGAWQLCVGETFVLGAPSREHSAADIELQANLSRKHATISHSDDGWHLEAQQATTVADRSVTSRVAVHSGDQICLGDRVRLGFRVPSPLSQSAVMDFESDHRPPYSVDGIILLVDQCLLGPRKDHHVCCSDWSDFVVLFRQGDHLMCRSRAAIEINGQALQGAGVLNHGDVVTGEELRFRIEQLL